MPATRQRAVELAEIFLSGWLLFRREFPSLSMASGTTRNFQIGGQRICPWKPSFPAVAYQIGCFHEWEQTKSSALTPYVRASLFIFRNHLSICWLEPWWIRKQESNITKPSLSSWFSALWSTLRQSWRGISDPFKFDCFQIFFASFSPL